MVSMSVNALVARASVPLVGALLMVGLATPSAAAESLPGPPARSGQPPIGGARLTGTSVEFEPQGASFNGPDMTAASWVLVDADTCEVLAAKAPHDRYRPASTLKTLTAITLMGRLKPTDTYTATKADSTTDGAAVGLAPGEKYTIDQLWHALLLPSANDAAIALANANGGIDATVAQMNARAIRLQAFDTVAKSPSGLDHDGQWTSAYDMALIARAAIHIPEFIAVSQTTMYKFPDVEPVDGKRRTHTIYGENRLLNHGYPGVIAGKTGFTTEAKRTFWVAAKRGDRTLIATMFRIEDTTENASIALLNWGFDHADELTPIGRLVKPLTNDKLSAVPASTTNEVALASELALATPTPTSTAPATSPQAVVVDSDTTSPWNTLVGLLVLLAGAVGALRLRAVRRQRRAATERARRRAEARESGVRPRRETRPTALVPPAPSDRERRPRQLIVRDHRPRSVDTLLGEGE